MKKKETKKTEKKLKKKRKRFRKRNNIICTISTYDNLSKITFSLSFKKTCTMHFKNF